MKEKTPASGERRLPTVRGLDEGERQQAQERHEQERHAVDGITDAGPGSRAGTGARCSPSRHQGTQEAVRTAAPITTHRNGAPSSPSDPKRATTRPVAHPEERRKSANARHSATVIETSHARQAAVLAAAEQSGRGRHRRRPRSGGRRARAREHIWSATASGTSTTQATAGCPKLAGTTAPAGSREGRRPSRRRPSLSTLPEWNTSKALYDGARRPRRTPSGSRCARASCSSRANALGPEVAVDRLVLPSAAGTGRA